MEDNRKVGEMKKLQFGKAIFHKGLNVTVRRGSKWRNLKMNERVQLVEMGAKLPPLQTAKIIGVMYLPFYLVPDSVLTREHDPSCRDREGLLDELQWVYDGFKVTDAVTVILFKVEK
jgi:hypothetical protein